MPYSNFEFPTGPIGTAKSVGATEPVGITGPTGPTGSNLDSPKTEKIVTDQYIAYRNENGQYHREGGPALIYPNGREFWYKNGRLHREDGPASYGPNGVTTQEWYKNGSYHRVGGPAIIKADGSEYWFQNGMYHREDGPAVVVPLTGKKDYYRNGVHISEPEFMATLKSKEDKKESVDKATKQELDKLFEDWRKEEKADEKKKEAIKPPAIKPPTSAENYTDLIGEITPLTSAQKDIILDAMKKMLAQKIDEQQRFDEDKQIEGKQTVNSTVDGRYYKDADGKYHREDGPALVNESGEEFWYKHGKLHREDGPAYKSKNGAEVWYHNGIPLTVAQVQMRKDKLEGQAQMKQLAKEELQKLEQMQQNKMLTFQDGYVKPQDVAQHLGYTPVALTPETRAWKYGTVPNLPTFKVDEDAMGPQILEKKLQGLTTYSPNGFKINQYPVDRLLEFVAKNYPQLPKQEAWLDDSSKSYQNGYGDLWWLDATGRYHRTDGPALVKANGDQYWYRHGFLHRENGPARVLDSSLTPMENWYLDGRALNRGEILKLKSSYIPKSATSGVTKTELTALGLLCSDENGFVHREDGPAEELIDGTQRWYKHGLLHRIDGPAVVKPNGYEEWHVEGKWITDQGEIEKMAEANPVISIAGTKRWYDADKQLHREGNLPALIRTNGEQIYYKHGRPHRTDGPAHIYPGRNPKYYLDGVEYTEQNWRQKVEKDKLAITNRRRMVDAIVNNLSPGDHLFGVGVRNHLAKEHYEAVQMRMKDSGTLNAMFDKLKGLGVSVSYDGMGDAYGKAKHHLYTLQTREGAKMTLHAYQLDDPNECIIPQERRGTDVSMLALDKNGARSLLAELNTQEVVNNLKNKVFRTLPNATPAMKQKLIDLGYAYGGTVGAVPAAKMAEKKPVAIPAMPALPKIETKVAAAPVGTGAKINPTTTTTKTMTAEKKGTTMDNMMEMLKRDAEEAMYSVAADQLTAGVKEAILMTMREDGQTPESLLGTERFLDSPYGKGLISFILGVGIQMAPVPFLQESDEAQRLAEKFRVNGMSTVGNKVVSVAVSKILPVIMGAVANLPKVSKSEGIKVRVPAELQAPAEHAETAELHEEQPVPAKQAALELHV